MNNKNLTADELESGLMQFYGSEEFFRHWTRSLIYTEGVQYLAEHAGAYWIIDAIASYQRSPAILRDQMLRAFQVWQLAVDLDAHSAVLTCVKDTGYEPSIRQAIEFTVFPIKEIKFYVSNGVLMLPSEY
jgi:Family of unknown function (DUF6876)